MLLHWEISKGRLCIRGHVLFTGAQVLTCNSTRHTITSHYLKYVCCESFRTGNPQLTTMLEWENDRLKRHAVRFMIQDHVYYSSYVGCVGCETVKKALGRSDGAPLTLSSRVIPQSLHQPMHLTAWTCRHMCTGGLQEVSTPAHWSLASSSVYTHMGVLPECLRHHQTITTW